MGIHSMSQKSAFLLTRFDYHSLKRTIGTKLLRFFLACTMILNVSSFQDRVFFIDVKAKSRQDRFGKSTDAGLNMIFSDLAMRSITTYLSE